MTNITWPFFLSCIPISIKPSSHLWQSTRASQQPQLLSKGLQHTRVCCPTHVITEVCEIYYYISIRTTVFAVLFQEYQVSSTLFLRKGLLTTTRFGKFTLLMLSIEVNIHGYLSIFLQSSWYQSIDCSIPFDRAPEPASLHRVIVMCLLKNCSDLLCFLFFPEQKTAIYRDST